MRKLMLMVLVMLAAGCYDKPADLPETPGCYVRATDRHQTIKNKDGFEKSGWVSAWVLWYGKTGSTWRDENMGTYDTIEEAKEIALKLGCPMVTTPPLED